MLSLRGPCGYKTFSFRSNNLSEILLFLLTEQRILPPPTQRGIVAGHFLPFNPDKLMRQGGLIGTEDARRLPLETCCRKG